jgi:hypothetical protein
MIFSKGGICHGSTEPFEAYLGDVEAQFDDVEACSKAVVSSVRNIETQPGKVEAQPGDVEAHPGATEACFRDVRSQTRRHEAYGLILLLTF